VVNTYGFPGAENLGSMYRVGVNRRGASNVVEPTSTDNDEQLIELDPTLPVWDRQFMVAPLVIVGTRDADGASDLAPKHMAMPMGWDNYFGFVCSPTHSTCANVARNSEFTVSFPKPSQVLFTSLAASPRLEDGDKPAVGALDTFPARAVDAEFVAEGYLYLECRHFRTIDGFGRNCLITGEIVCARADGAYLRHADIDDQDLLARSPLLAYVAPGRFATIDRTDAFPFPAGMRK
jgi:flavin reductase (DIM6/NTAB) family NADH-FMN oxidoreductase RutF